MKYQYQRIVSLFLALLTVFTAVSVPVFAEDATANASTQEALESIYDSVGYSQELAEGRRIDLTNIPTLNGVTNPTARAYKIDSLAAYQNFVTLVNNGNTFSGKTVYLACNLDLSSIANQAPIGFNKGAETTANTFTSTASAKFSGTLNGQGYAITGISITKTLVDTCYSAFIGWAVNTTVTDLVLSGTVVHEKGTYSGLNNFVGTGGLIACAEGTNTVDNVYCDIDVKGLRQTAGFIARGGATVTNSTNAGDVIGSDCAGGFFGFASGTLSATNCLNTGRMQAGKVAGILPRGRTTTTIANCVNAGTMVATNGGYAGGIVGVTDHANAKVTVSGCTNSGRIVSDGQANDFGTQNEGTLTVASDNKSVPYIGYNAEAFLAVDLTSVPNITEWTSSSTATTYQITNAAGLVKLSEIVRAGNSLSGKKVYLANDINMADVTLLPIGKYVNSATMENPAKTPFSGIFDGQGHAIKNLSMTFSEETEVGFGLFGLLSSATVRNLIIDQSCTFEDTINSGYTGMAAIAGYSEGATTITNVATYATLTSKAHAAGMVGRGGVASITYCENRGTITTNNCAGGMTAFRVGGAIKNCVNYGTINSSAAGGLIGRVSHAVTYQDLVNYGTVLASGWAGGIVGRTMDNALTLNRCINYGSVNGHNSDVLVDGMYTVWTAEGCKGNVTMIECSNLYRVGYNAARVADVPLPVYDIKHYDSMAKQTAYVVRDAEGMIKLAEIVNAGNTLAGVTVYLTNDVNLFGKTMLPIGTSTPFSGTFDGRGYAIRGLTMKIDCSVEGNPNLIGLFGYVSHGTVKNLTVDATCSFVQTGEDSTYSGSASAIVAKANVVTVENVKNQANVTGILHTGGIGGRGSISASYCVNTGTIKGANSAGGIFAYATNDVLDCVNYGDVSADNATNGGKAGGITGRQENENVRYINAYNHGVVTSDYMAGGIMGAVRVGCYMLNCVNYGVAAPLPGHDVITSNRYNVEKGYAPQFSGMTVSDQTNIGYSAEIAEAEKVDLEALLACGLAKNIENYNHGKDNATVNYLIIDSPSDMRRFAQIINTTTRGNINGVQKTFYLACDIDMSGYSFTGDRTVADANTIAPIGWDKITKDSVLTDTTATVTGLYMCFAGIFDGQGHTISGLKMGTDDAQNSYLGLFGYLDGATVKNVIMDADCSIYTSVSTNNFKAGILAGGASASTVRNVWTQGFVSGQGIQIAGMIGRPSNVSFLNCTNSANVNGVGNSGGFGGFTSTMKLYSCRNTGNISGDSYAGGFSARDRGTGMYFQCVNTGNVKSATWAGAIAGYKDEEMTTLYASCLNYGLVAVNGTQTGKLFGGTLDSTCIFRELTKTSYNSKADNYHVAQMLDAKYQIKSNGNGTFDLRLVASVDGLSYLSAGFILNVEGMGSATLTTNKVYTSILATDGEETITYQPAEKFADTSKYFITYTIKNLSNDYLAKLGTDAFRIKGFLMTNDSSLLGYKKIDPISIANTYTAKVTTAIGTIHNFSTAKSYTLPGSNVTVKLQYQAWPSVCVDENGVIYAFISGRLEHTDPFGHHLMYKSYDGGASWEGPITINDTPMDDRDIGITYLGGGRMLATYFRIDAASYMTKDDTLVTADGVTITGMGTYTGWQSNTGLGSTAAARAATYEAIKAYWATMTAAELTSGTWSMVSTDYGVSWSEPLLVPLTTPHGAIQLSTGDILYVGRNGSKIVAYMSYDGGYSWSFNSTVYDNSSKTGEYYGQTFCEPHVIEMKNGRWLAAIRIQVEDITIDGVKYTGSGYQADGTPIWKTVIGSVTTTYKMQTAADGTKSMVEYNYTGSLTTYRIFTQYSDDEGETWSKPALVTAKSLVSGSIATDNNAVYGTPPHLVQMEDGTVIMVYATRNGNIGERALVSYDGGVTWGDEIKLCDRPKDKNWSWSSMSYTGYLGSDIGYPASVYLGNGQFITVYYQAAEGDSYSSFLFTKWSLT